MGGKSTFLCCRVKLAANTEDVHDHIPAGVDVPLEATLCHEPRRPGDTPRHLSKKEMTRATRTHLRKGQTALRGGATILNIFGEQQHDAQAFLPTLSVAKPEALLQFRIEDVSSNHTSKAFVLRISTRPKSSYAELVAPCHTQQISVLSKLRQTKKRAMYAARGVGWSREEDPHPIGPIVEPRFGTVVGLSLIHISSPRDKRQSRMPSSA